MEKIYYGIIYKATNKINGKVYIGQTISTLDKRKADHYSYARTKKQLSYFYKALNKYQKENFNWKILEQCNSKYDLDLAEEWYIRYYKTFVAFGGYNLTFGGEGSTGFKHTKESKHLISIRKIGTKCGKDNPFYGRTHTKEALEENSRKHSGKKHPQWKGGVKELGLPLYATYAHRLTVGTRRRCWAENGLEIVQVQCFWCKKWYAPHISSVESNIYKGTRFYCSKKCKKLNPLFFDRIRKKYIITVPNGKEFFVHGLKEFCLRYNKCRLYPSELSSCASGKCKHHKGFRCRYYNPETDADIPFYS